MTILTSNVVNSQTSTFIARVDSSGLNGYINFSGDMIIPFQFKEAKDFKDGVAEVYQSEGAKLINPKGVPMINIRFYGFGYNEGLMITGKDRYLNGAYQGSMFGFMDMKGKIMIQPAFEEVKSFSEGLAPVKSFETGKWGYVNRKGKIVIAPLFDKAEEFTEGLAAIELNKKWGFINKRGETVIQTQYERAQPFSEGLAAIKKKGKYGFITKTGETEIEFSYDLVKGFKEGLAAVNIGGKEEWGKDKTGIWYKSGGGKWGYINKKGEIAIPLNYSQVSDFINGIAIIRPTEDSLAAAINKEGEYLIQPSFWSIGSFVNGLAPAAKEMGKFGFIDTKGDWIIKPHFDRAYEFVKIEQK